MTAENELAKLAWRVIDEAERVIETIEPESNEEAELLNALRQRMCNVGQQIFTKAFTDQEIEGWFYGHIK